MYKHFILTMEPIGTDLYKKWNIPCNNLFRFVILCVWEFYSGIKIYFRVFAWCLSGWLFGLYVRLIYLHAFDSMDYVSMYAFTRINAIHTSNICAELLLLFLPLILLLLLLLRLCVVLFPRPLATQWNAFLDRACSACANVCNVLRPIHCVRLFFCFSTTCRCR